MNADEVIHQEIAALNGAQRGTIRIGTYLSCSIHWIPKIIREFQQKHPDIIIQVIEGVEGELADWIQERRVDIGFISLQKNHKYQFLPVMNDLMYAVVPENDPLAKEEEIPIEAFEDAPTALLAHLQEDASTNVETTADITNKETSTDKAYIQDGNKSHDATAKDNKDTSVDSNEKVKVSSCNPSDKTAQTESNVTDKSQNN